MDGAISYRFDAIANHGSQLSGDAAAFMNEIDELQSLMNRAESEWTGSGADSFQNVSRDYVVSATEMKEALAALGGTTTAAGEGMNMTDMMNRNRYMAG